MAFMSQQRKKELAPDIKRVLKKYGMKGTIAVNNHSTLVVNIKSGPLDLIGNYGVTASMPESQLPSNMQVNEYWIDKNFSGECREFLEELKAAMMQGNHDRSDIMTDYFDVGWYIDINVGGWNRPYELTE